MKLIISKSQFGITPRWTDNIDDDDINPLIKQACQDQFRDVISKTMYDAIAAVVQDILTGEQGNAWVDQAYDSGSIVEYNEVYYIANGAIIQGETAPGVNVKWVANELITFWANFVVEYLVFCAYKEFLTWHGTHFGQGGQRKYIENTSFELTEDEKAPLRQSVRGTIALKYTKMSNELAAKSYKFDGVTYVGNDNVSVSGPRMQIFDV